MNGRRFQQVSVAAAVLVGAWLRFWHIGRLSLWFDEGYTAWVIDRPVSEIVRMIRADTAPPLYYLLLHGWSQVFGRSEAALRSFSAGVGVLTIPIVAGIARRVLIRPAAVVAATWLFVLSFAQTWYSQEARGYELAAFLVAVMAYGVVGYLHKPRWEWLAMVVAAGIVGLYVNNFMGLYIVGVGAAGMILPGSMPMRRRVRAGLIVTACLAAAYLPWIGTLGSQVRRVDEYFWIPRPTFDAVCEVLARCAGVGHYWSWDQYTHWLYYDTARGVPRAAAMLLLGGVAAAGILLRGRDRRAALGLATVALLPIGMAVVYSLCRRSIFLPAAFLPSTVILPVFMAGVLTLKRGWIGGAAVGVLILLSAVNVGAFEHEQSKEDWRGAAAAVADMPAGTSRLIVFMANEGELPFDYYYRVRSGEAETGTPGGFFDVDPPRTQRRVLSENDLRGLLGQIASRKFQEIVLVAAHEGYSDPNRLTLRCLQESMRQEQRTELKDITVWRFSLR